MLKYLLLALKLYWRDLRAGQWTIVILTLILATSATISMNSLIERLSLGFDKQRAQFLGGDFMISSPSPIPIAWKTKAQELRLRTAEAWVYPSVVSANNHLQLANIQAISTDYPLLSDKPINPNANSIWVEERLLSLLSINQNDLIRIGAAAFPISKLLSVNDVKLYTGIGFAPRIIIRIGDANYTKTILPGSRIDYRLFIAGDKSNLNSFKDWINSKLTPGQTLTDAHTEKNGLENIITTTESYFQLLLLLCLMLGGIGIALSIYQYMRSHFSYIALWRCIGATKLQIIMILMFQLIFTAFIAGVIGVVLGYLLQNYFIYLFQDTIQIVLPPTGGFPILFGLSTSLLLLFIFSYSLCSQLPKASPLVLWRNELKPHILLPDFYILISLIFLLSLGYWYLHFANIVLYFSAILTILIAAMFIFFGLLLNSLRILLRFFDGTIRRGISEITHHVKSVSMQLVGFSLIWIALIVLSWIRSDIIAHWQESFSPNTPNYFAFNLSANDRETVRNLLSQNHIPVEPIYPMVRGRLISLNGKPILSVVPAEAEKNNALHRELNISSMMIYPSDNKITEGEQWTARDQQKALISIEEKLAHDLNIHLGDQLQFQIGDQQVTGTVSNMRSLQWSSFHPNFFIIFPPGILDRYPTTYITSFHLFENQSTLLNQLESIVPNATILDIKAVLSQIQEIINKIAFAIQYLFIYSLLLGILIFVTSIQSSKDERRQTYSLLRILGASNQYIRRSQIAEWLVLLILLISVALVGSVLIIYLIEHYLLTSF